MKRRRRGFWRVAGLTGTTALGLAATQARASSGHSKSLDAKGEDEWSVLVDTTLCAGCRACEAACSEANGLPAPGESDLEVGVLRETKPEKFTVVNAFGPLGHDGEDRFAEAQCMRGV